MCRQSFMNFQLDSEPRTTYYGTADFDIWQKMVTNLDEFVYESQRKY